MGVKVYHRNSMYTYCLAKITELSPTARAQGSIDYQYYYKGKLYESGESLMFDCQVGIDSIIFIKLDSLSPEYTLPVYDQKPHPAFKDINQSPYADWLVLPKDSFRQCYQYSNRFVW